MIGQSFRAKADSTFNRGSGVEDNLSDIVAKLQVKPGTNISLDYKTRIDQDNFAPRRTELGLIAGPPALRIDTNYIFFADQEAGEFPGREEISGSINAKLDRFWRTRFSANRDLSDDGGLRSIGLSFTFECECFVFDIAFNRNFFQNRDVKPSDSVAIRLTFKTLGGVQGG